MRIAEYSNEAIEANKRIVDFTVFLFSSGKDVIIETSPGYFRDKLGQLDTYNRRDQVVSDVYNKWESTWQVDEFDVLVNNIITYYLEVNRLVKNSDRKLLSNISMRELLSLWVKNISSVQNTAKIPVFTLHENLRSISRHIYDYYRIKSIYNTLEQL